MLIGKIKRYTIYLLLISRWHIPTLTQINSHKVIFPDTAKNFRRIKNSESTFWGPKNNFYQIWWVYMIFTDQFFFLWVSYMEKGMEAEYYYLTLFWPDFISENQKLHSGGRMKNTCQLRPSGETLIWGRVTKPTPGK